MFVHLVENIVRLHILPITHHSAGLKTLRISPFRQLESHDAVLDIVDVQDPIRADGFPQALAFDNELLAPVPCARFVAIEIEPLEIRPLQFAFRAGVVVRVGLVVALGERSNFVIGI